MYTSTCKTVKMNNDEWFSDIDDFSKNGYQMDKFFGSLKNAKLIQILCFHH